MKYDAFKWYLVFIYYANFYSFIQKAKKNEKLAVGLYSIKFPLVFYSMVTRAKVFIELLSEGEENCWKNLAIEKREKLIPKVINAISTSEYNFFSHKWNDEKQIQ